MKFYKRLSFSSEYLSADRQHAKCFFAWNGLEEEGEGTVGETYYIESV